jgi:Protein of unknown function (DUF2946)
MDDLVKAAIRKWPNVPACYGWLGLDSRGQWWMRDDRAQLCGAFASGLAAAKGSLLKHDKLIEFIARNYEREASGPMQGAWFFQNGPQKVYLELEFTPFIMRVSANKSTHQVTTHTGIPAQVQRCLLDEAGHLYLATDLGLGLVHTQDMAQAADLIEAGVWVPEEVTSADLPKLFDYIVSPQSKSCAESPAS